MVYVSAPMCMLPVRGTLLVLSSTWYDSPPLPVPGEPNVSWIQLWSAVAVQLQKSPVVMVMRPLLAAAATVALVGEIVRLPGAPSCVTVNEGGDGRFVTSVMLPVRVSTQEFAATE